MNAIFATVVIKGSSWEGVERGMYCFEVFVNGVRGQVHVQEDIAFDFLGAWTLDANACLEVLRAHRGELAQALAWKIRAGGTLLNGHYLLAQQDLESRSAGATLLQFSSKPGSARRRTPR